LQDEGVISSQREWVGGEVVQLRLTEANRWLYLAPRILLAENVGDVIGAEGACRVSSLDRARYGLRAVVANEVE
jgi:hypothetical protein